MSEKSTLLFLRIASHDNTSFQKNSVILQENNKCSRDSSFTEGTGWRIYEFELKTFIVRKNSMVQQLILKYSHICV